MSILSVLEERSSSLHQEERKPTLVYHCPKEDSFAPLMGLENTWAVPDPQHNSLSYPCPDLGGTCCRSPLSATISSDKSSLCRPNQHKLLCSFWFRNESGFAGNTPHWRSPQRPSVIPRTRGMKTEVSSPWFSVLLVLAMLCHRG